MTGTDIEWATFVWNVFRGCRRVSAGCGKGPGEGGCYAEKQAYRFSGPGQPYEGLVTMGKHGPRWTGIGRFVPGKLAEPLRLRAPKDGSRHRIFVNSMSDLFFEEFSNAQIAAVFGVMAACPQHDFLVLTKRAKRMREWFEWVAAHDQGDAWTNCHWEALCAEAEMNGDLSGVIHSNSGGLDSRPWPLPNVWLGVSAENQEMAEDRIPELLTTPAVVRWVSAEPLLGPVDFFAFLKTPLRDRCLGKLTPGEKPVPGVDWVVVGGESGRGARPFDLDWARTIVRDCRAASVPVFVKQLGDNSQWPLAEAAQSAFRSGRIRLKSKGGDPVEWPEDLRVREWPAEARRREA